MQVFPSNNGMCQGDILKTIPVATGANKNYLIFSGVERSLFHHSSPKVDLL